VKTTYTEGPQAGGNFERLARAVLQAPKVALPKKQSKAKPAESENIELRTEN
jgi:hypothetical protein